MSANEAIRRHVDAMPERERAEVLDFIEFLESKRRREDGEWSAFSLSSAMRGMEDEESLYTVDDVKERF